MAVQHGIRHTQVLPPHVGDSLWVTEASYIVYTQTRGGVPWYYAKNGLTGQIQFSGTGVATINNIIASVTGGTIFFKAGIYEVASNVLVDSKDGVTIRGEGEKTVFRDSGAIVLEYVFRITNSNNVQIRDLTIECIKSNKGLIISGSSNSLIHGCYVKGSYPTVNYPLQGFVIDDGNFFDLLGGSYGIVISDCVATGCKNEGFSIYGFNSNHNAIIGCTASENGSYGYIIERNSYNNIISGCTAKDNLIGTAYIGLLDAQKNVIIGNTIIENVRRVSSVGIKLFWHSIDNEIIGNIITNTDYGIYAINRASSNKIIGNKVISPGNSTTMAPGIWISTSYNTIESNTVPTIQIAAPYNSVIGNTVKHSNTGIFVKSDYNTIQNNHISGCARGIQINVDAGSASYNYLQGNMIQDYNDDIATTLSEAASIGEDHCHVAEVNRIEIGMKITIGGETFYVQNVTSATYGDYSGTVEFAFGTTFTGNHIIGTAFTGTIRASWGLRQYGTGTMVENYAYDNIIRSSVPTPVLVTNGDMTCLRNTGYVAPGEERSASGTLTAGVANAIAFSWNNPELQDVLIKKVVVEVTTGGGTVGSHLDVGIADDAAGTNRGTEFFNDLLLNNAQINDSWVAGDGGTQTKWVFCEDSVAVANDWVVGQILDANAAALVGRYYIVYTGR